MEVEETPKIVKESKLGESHSPFSGYTIDDDEDVENEKSTDEDEVESSEEEIVEVNLESKPSASVEGSKLYESTYKVGFGFH